MKLIVKSNCAHAVKYCVFTDVFSTLLCSYLAAADSVHTLSLSACREVSLCVTAVHLLLRVVSGDAHCSSHTITPDTSSVNSDVHGLFSHVPVAVAALHTVSTAAVEYADISTLCCYPDWSLQCGVMWWMRVRPSCTVHTQHSSV
jgi:hypothetical protein